jgi:L-malate glycosyltransferase
MSDSNLTVLILSAASNIHTVRWVNALAERGLKVHLAFLPNHAPSSQHKIADNVKLHQLNVAGRLGYYVNFRQLKKICNTVEADIVNAHFASGYGTLARVAKLKPLLLSVWGSDVYDFPYKNPLAMQTIKRNLNYAAALASTSECMARQVNTLVGEKDIFITPFGVSIKNFPPKTQTEKITSSSIIRIGNIKTLKPKYGIDTLIKATFYLLKNLSTHGRADLAHKIRVDIYGEGPQKQDLESLIRSLKLNKTVILRGAIPNTEVPRILTTFDVFCATSTLDSESFGVAVVEAMAASIPVVATDVDGFREVTADGETAVIVERDSPRAIAVALESIIVDESLKKKLSEAGRQRVVDKYNWNDNVTTMIDAYWTVVNRGRQ